MTLCYISSMKLGLGYLTIGLLICVTACSDHSVTPQASTASGSAAGGSGGHSTSSSSAGGAYSGPTIEVELTIENGVTNLPVEEVDICVLDFGGLDCVMSDIDGKATLIVPAEAKVHITLVKESFVPALVGATTSAEGQAVTAPMIPAVIAATIASLAEVELDETKGQMVLTAIGYSAPNTMVMPAMENVSFSLKPTSGIGPLYVAPNNAPDPSLTKTGPRGGALVFNADPGDYILTATHDTLPCTGFMAHAGSEANTYEMRVMKGYVTYMTTICGEPTNAGAGGAGAGGAGAGGQ